MFIALYTWLLTIIFIIFLSEYLSQKYYLSLGYWLIIAGFFTSVTVMCINL